MAQSKMLRRLKDAKVSFVTRRADFRQAAALIQRPPQAGDLCLARVDRLGHHARLELPTGRRAFLYPGDEILLAYGARYATDQFHSVVPATLEPCEMVAAGGIASRMISRNPKTRIPTQITPIGLIADRQGEVLNLKNFAMDFGAPDPKHYPRPHVMAVVGSSMNAGKTTTVAELGRLMLRSDLRPCAIKLTGTGSGGDLWKYGDCGIDPVFDFTDGGYATTVDVPISELETLFLNLMQAAGPQIDIVLVEIADGLYQKETSGLLRSSSFRQLLDSVVFAAGDPMAGVAGIQFLRDLGIEPSALAGAVTATPLAVRELEEVLDVEIFSLSRFNEDDSALNIFMRSAHPMERHRIAKLA